MDHGDLSVSMDWLMIPQTQTVTATQFTCRGIIVWLHSHHKTNCTDSDDRQAQGFYLASISGPSDAHQICAADDTHATIFFPEP